MATTPKHRLKQRDKVLLAARKCFIRHGFHATGMAEIAKTCRMSAGNIYHYFQNKDAIVQAIADETRSAMIPVLRSLENYAEPIEGVVEIILQSLRWISRDANARLWMEIMAEAPRNERIRDICMTFDRDLEGVLKRLMQRALGRGQLAAEVDMDSASLWLIALLDGAISRLSMQPGLDLTRTLDGLARSIRQGLCRAGA